MAVTITNDAGTTRTNLGLGDAATKTVGTASGNIPVLDSSGDLPTSTYTDTVYTHPTTAGNKHIPTAGAADQVLTYSASGTATWQDSAGGGKILQVVSTTVTAQNSTTSNALSSTGADVGLNVTITPTSATSRFLITISIGQGTTVGSNSWVIQLSRSGTRIGNGAGSYGSFIKGNDRSGGNGTDSNHGVGGNTNHYLDTTSGTIGSARTYKGGLVVEGGGTGYINRNESGCSESTTSVHCSKLSSTITVMEVEV